MSLVVATLAERPDLAAAVEDLMDRGWPPFMGQDPVERRLWHRLAADLPELQVVLVDDERPDVLIACGHSVPFRWDGATSSLPEEGWDAVLEQGIADLDAGRVPTAVSALAITVDPAHRGGGLSGLMVEALRTAAARQGFADLVAPVRPSRKAEHPHVDIDEYLGWTTSEGLPWDPWLRVHVRVGAEVVGACRRSMRITGTVGEWEAWTGARLAGSGPQVVPGALVPVDVDLTAGEVTYVEPNVWVHHRVPA